MRAKTWKKVAVLACTGLAVSAAQARPDFPETEDNNTKAAANAATLAVGDSVSGSTTGTSTSVAGPASADYFRVKTTSAPLGIYQHRLSLSSTTQFQTATIRGLSQTSPGVIGTGDNTAQTASSTLVAGVRTVQWYGFGKEEEVYYRVTGTTTTTATYTSTLSTSTVTPLDFTATSIYAGDVTIGPATGNTADMDWWLYDSNLNAIPCAGMDSGPVVGVRTINLTPGTYFLAFSSFNFANNQASCPPETFFSTVLDFPNAASNSSTSTTITNINAKFTSTAGVFETSGLVQNEPFQINWIQFTVVTAPTVAGTGTATPAAVAQGANTDFKVTVFPGGSGTLADIANPPQLSGVRVDVAQLTGNMSPDWLYLLQDGITADWKTTYMVPVSAPIGGPYSLPFEITQGGASPSTFTGSIALTVTPPPPANDPCTGAVDITAVPYTSPLVQYFYATTDTNANPSCDSSSNSAGANRGVWWKYTATANGTLMVNRDSPTSEDTVTSVWTGADCNTLTQIACMDSDATPFAVPVVNGTTYYIMVSYWFSTAPGTTDEVGVTVDFVPPPSPPANDACAGATVISAVPFDSGAISVGGAAADANVACNTGGATQVNNGIWFTYTPSSNCTAVIGETGSLGAIHAVYTGPDCNTLTEVQCFVNETGNTFAATMGTQYYILVGVQGTASAGPTSTMTVTLDCGQPPANDLCSGAVALTIGSTETVTSPVFATHDIDSTCNAGAETRFGVWFSYTTGADAGTLDLTDNSSNDVIFQVFSGDCNNLTPIACSDAEAPASLVLPQPNTTYYILMGMWSAATAPASDYSVTATAFTAVSGACCTGSTCTVGVLASACTGTWLGANSTCDSQPQNSESPAIAIPDASEPTGGPNVAGTVVRTLVVTDPGTITTFAVQVGITHTWGGDVRIVLTAPGGSPSAELFSRPAGTAAVPTCPAPFAIANGNDLNGVYTFTDSAATGINNAFLTGPSPLASGSYQAQNCDDTLVSLNTVFAGVPLAGTWTLTVTDEDSAITGTLNSWGLIFNGGVAPCTPSTESCCRGTTCNPVAAGTCTGTIAGSNSLVVTSCGGGNAFASCCYADFNHDGTQSIDDLFLYFNAYFTGHPLADFGGDGTSQPTIDDLFLYINAYFGTCS